MPTNIFHWNLLPRTLAAALPIAASALLFADGLAQQSVGAGGSDQTSSGGATAGTASRDSTSAAAEHDSLSYGQLFQRMEALEALPDSLTAGAMRDSLMAHAGEDSLRAQAVADSVEAARKAAELPALLPLWEPEAALRSGDLNRLLPQGMDDIVEALPSGSIRVNGERGMPTFTNISPVDPAAFETIYDGVPTRSPADLDPGVWDRSAIGLNAVTASPMEGVSAGGGGVVYAVSEPAEPGRTVFRSHFHKARYQTFLRGVSITTPRTTRMVRFDFEEWKTEDGYNFTANATLGDQPDYGKSKMRRFRVGFDAETDLGRLSLGFGRGTRLYVGSVDAVEQSERWTGEISAGLDHQNESRRWRWRAYHLDWHTDDQNHDITSDAARDGMSLSRVPVDGGFEFSLVGEQWNSRFDRKPPATLAVTPPPAGLGRLRLGLRSARGAWLGLDLAAEAAAASHTSERYDGAGLAALRLGRRERMWFQVSASRSLRAPTLLESDGFQSWDMVGGFALTRLGGGELPFEVHERARVAVAGRGRSLDWEVGVERYRLRDGIGWEPEDQAAIDGDAFTIGGLSTTTDQLTASLKWRVGGALQGLLFDVDGHYVLGDLPIDKSRGAGWPEARAYARVRWWKQVFGPREQIRLQYRLRFMGAHYDDLLAPYATPGELLGSNARHDIRGSLQLRDAELYLEMRNFPSLTIIEVTGTRRRGWDLIWGFSWPFYN